MEFTSRVVRSIRQGVVVKTPISGLGRSVGFNGMSKQKMVLHCIAEPGNVAGVETEKVTFSVARHVDFGQSVKVVGSVPELGNWEVGSGLSLLWEDGDIWKCEAEIPSGALEYKYIIGDTEESCVEWYPGENLEVVVEKGEPVTLSDIWTPEVFEDVVGEAEGNDAVDSPESVEGNFMENPVKNSAENIVTIPGDLGSEKATAPVVKQDMDDSSASETINKVVGGENKVEKKMSSQDDGDKPMKTVT